MNITAAVTVCDIQGIIVYLNEQSARVFKNDGGKEFLGKSLFDCRLGPALEKGKGLHEVDFMSVV